MILLALLYGLFCFYFVLSGIKDAMLWSKKGAEAFTWNEHIVFVLERATIVLLSIVSVLAVELTANFLVKYILVLVASLLAFAFWHNGTLYEARNRIDWAYPNGFWSNPSHSSTAKLNFTLTTRLLMWLVSVVIMVVLFLK